MREECVESNNRLEKSGELHSNEKGNELCGGVYVK
jgi:hypothetical protein